MFWNWGLGSEMLGLIGLLAGGSRACLLFKVPTVCMYMTSETHLELNEAFASESRMRHWHLLAARQKPLPP